MVGLKSNHDNKKGYWVSVNLWDMGKTGVSKSTTEQNRHKLYSILLGIYGMYMLCHIYAGPYMLMMMLWH